MLLNKTTEGNRCKNFLNKTVTTFLNNTVTTASNDRYTVDVFIRVGVTASYT